MDNYTVPISEFIESVNDRVKDIKSEFTDSDSTMGTAFALGSVSALLAMALQDMYNYSPEATLEFMSRHHMKIGQTKCTHS